MRLLHTSDWHLGRTLHGHSLLDHQRAFLTWLTDEAARRAVDLVVVAGDIYDRAVPPTDAVALLDEALAGFAAAGVPVLLTSGNHDSAVRLGFGTELAAHAGIHLRTRPAELARPVVVGDVGVYGIPYLLPDAVAEQLGAERSHESVLRAAVAAIRADADNRRLPHVVVVAHAFVTGGAACESERDISVGGIGNAPVEIFDGFDYVALGHLHGAQRLGEHVRYSGSPVPFSFSERHHTKSVTVVDVDEAGVRTELVPAPIARSMAELRGRLDDLLAAADGPPSDAWVKVVLTDPARPPAPMERLRERWPHTLVLEFRPDVEQVAADEDLIRLRTVSDPVEVCAMFVQWVDSTYPDRARREALQQAIDAVRAAELSA